MRWQRWWVWSVIITNSFTMSPQPEQHHPSLSITKSILKIGETSVKAFAGLCKLWLQLVQGEAAGDGGKLAVCNKYINTSSKSHFSYFSIFLHLFPPCWVDSAGATVDYLIRLETWPYLIIVTDIRLETWQREWELSPPARLSVAKASSALSPRCLYKAGLYIWWGGCCFIGFIIPASFCADSSYLKLLIYIIDWHQQHETAHILIETAEI